MIFFTVVVPALHGHSKVSCLNFSTVYRDSWILTGKTWNNVCAPCKLKLGLKTTLVRQSEWEVARWFQTNLDSRSRGLGSSPSQVLGKDPLLSKPCFFTQDQKLVSLRNFRRPEEKLGGYLWWTYITSRRSKHSPTNLQDRRHFGKFFEREASTRRARGERGASARKETRVEKCVNFFALPLPQNPKAWGSIPHWGLGIFSFVPRSWQDDKTSLSIHPLVLQVIFKVPSCHRIKIIGYRDKNWQL